MKKRKLLAIIIMAVLFLEACGNEIELAEKAKTKKEEIENPEDKKVEETGIEEE